MYKSLKKLGALSLLTKVSPCLQDCAARLFMLALVCVRVYYFIAPEEPKASCATTITVLFVYNSLYTDISHSFILFYFSFIRVH